EPDARQERAAQRSPRRVVIDDRAHAVRAVDEREPEQERVPHDPERVGPLARDEGEVDRADALTGDEVDEEVAEDEDREDDARGPHVDPAPLLEVDAPSLTGARRARRGDRGHQAPPKTCMRWRGVKPTMRMTQSTMTAQKICAWYFAPF